MKRAILIILLASMVLGSCAIMPALPEYPEFHSPSAAWYWIGKNITYKRDIETHGRPDDWQTPAETMESREGDCEDMAILFADIMEKQFETDIILSEVILYNYINDIDYHMTPKINGEFIEKWVYNYTPKTRKEYTWTEMKGILYPDSENSGMGKR
jgi:hypothetical protein